jgi:serine phosphatase RsbU (regulator of sigma subunit)
MISLASQKEQLMDRIIRHFSNQSKLSILVRAYISVFIIAFIDYATGPDLSLLVFYLIPIVITSWFVGRRAGIYNSLVCAIGLSIHDIIFIPFNSLNSITAWVVFFWNPLITLGVFIIVAYVLSAMRRAEDEKLRCEFKFAADVQSRLLPQSFPPMKTLNYAASCKSAYTVSGDYYDFLLIEPQKLGIAVGDIAGKGISAALLMANLQGLLRSHAPLHYNRINDLMCKINEAIYVSTDSSRFVTLFFGIYDDVEQTLTFVNAGHNPPIIFRRKNGHAVHSENKLNEYPTGDNIDFIPFEMIRIDTGNTVVGAFSNMVYSAKTIQMRKDDLLVIFTDGISEARNYAHELYSEERLIDLIAANLHESPERLHDTILNDVSRYAGDEIQFDDMTLVVAKVV